MKSILIYSTFSILLLSFTSPGNECSKKCPNSAACANEFRSLTVSLSVKNDNMTRYQTIRAEDGLVVNLSPIPAMPENTYLLLTDAEKDLTTKKGKEFYFVGYWYNTEILREKFTIGQDGKHVIVLKGNTKIQVKPGC